MSAGKPRVVVLDASIAPTGGLAAACNIARAIGSAADMVLVLPKGTRVRASDAADFDEVTTVPMPQIRRSAGDLLRYAPGLWRAARRLRALLRDGDVLVVNDFYLMHGGVLRLLGFRGRVVTWVRIDPCAFPGPLRRLWLGVARSASTRVIAVSDFIARRLDDAGLPYDRVYDPVDPRRAEAVPAESRSRTVVHIANYTRGKGQDDAIAAFLPIAARDPAVRLLFHGGDMGRDGNRAFLAELRATAAASGHGDRIIFRDFVDQPARPLAESSFALVLSHRESFSLTCLEASQNARAVIAFRSGGPEEIIEDGVTGILCDVGDTAAVTAAMARLLADPDGADAMGRRGAALVRERFAPGTFAAHMRRLLLAPATPDAQ